MPSTGGSPQDNEYINDLSRQPSHRSSRSDSPPDHAGLTTSERGEAGLPRLKRIACIICRKRKLKCDGNRPKCATCARLGHKCAYDEVRRKSGPKRGYVKELEARLAQVETQLKSKDRAKIPVLTRSASYTNPGQPTLSQPDFQLNDVDMGLSLGDPDMLAGFLGTGDAQPSRPKNQSASNLMPTVDVSLAPEEPFSWEMISLGLEEPLPPQDMIDDLHQIYFDKIHPSMPMMHKYRYLAAMNLAPNMRPAICLRYAMWTLACSVVEKYANYQEVFYHRARKYAEHDEMKGHGESFITVGHTQCWSIIATYEFKMMYFPRAWMSAGRSTRLAQMTGLHRLDGVGLEVKQTLPPPRDWTDREERRRTFWVAYCQDRYASIGTGWPMTIEEKDIMTNLPATEEAFNQSRAQTTSSLIDAMSAEGASSLSSFAGVVLMACLFGRNLTHLHRPDPNDRPEDIANGEFWKRHRQMENILLNTSMYLPDHLRIPTGIRDPNIVFLNMNIHTSTICLHSAAVLKAEKNGLDPTFIRQSRERCVLAAGEIVNIMRLTSHIDVGHMNPFISFCLYVAARIFTQAYKKGSREEATRDNLQFLLNAMQAIRKKNPLTESFIVQLMVDLEGTDIDTPSNNSRFRKPGHSDSYSKDSICLAVLESDNRMSESNDHEPVFSSRPSDNHSATSGTHPQSDFSRSHFSMPTREHRSPQQSQRRFNAPPTQAQGVLLGNGWGEKFPGGPDGHALEKAYDKRWSGNAVPSSHAHTQFDTEMSSDQTSDRHTSLSNHQTPPNSLHSSSNTSYSPPDVGDADPSSRPPGMRNHPQATFFDPSGTFTSFSPPSQDHYPHSPGNTSERDYAIPPGWEVGPDGVLIPSSAADLAQMSDPGWAGMLENIGWDPNSMSQADMHWREGLPDGHRV